MNGETDTEFQQPESDTMLVLLFEFEAKLQLEQWDKIREMLNVCIREVKSVFNNATE
jgi:hypothetical protein